MLAVKAGADILLKPSDPTQADRRGAWRRSSAARSRARASTRAARRVLELKARTGVAFSADRRPRRAARRRRLAGASRDSPPTSRARAVTLLRDRDNSLLPGDGDGRAAVVQYMPETELRAGKRLRRRAFARRLPVRAAFKMLAGDVGAAMLDSHRAAGDAARIA